VLGYGHAPNLGPFFAAVKKQHCVIGARNRPMDISFPQRLQSPYWPMFQTIEGHQYSRKPSFRQTDQVGAEFEPRLPICLTHLGAPHARARSQLCSHKMFDRLDFLIANRDQDFSKRRPTSDLTGKLELITRS